MNRRKFIKLSAVSAGAIIGKGLLADNTKKAGAASLPAAKGPISDSKVKSMKLKISYVTEIVNPKKSGETIELWIPLPQSDDEQEVTQLAVDSPVAFHINAEPYFGNKMIRMLLTRATRSAWPIRYGEKRSAP